MQKYNVTGMSCAACSARVEKAVNSLAGVTACSVSLLTNSMGVEGSASPAEVIKAVTDAGYGASVKGSRQNNAANADPLDSLQDTETPKLRRRLLWSLGFLLVLMYISMGHMMWSWPLPSFLDGNHIAMGLAELLLAAAVMVINQRFFISGFRGLIHRAPNMDSLVALGSAASFAYSVFALFAMSSAQLAGNGEKVTSYMHEFYFESAAMILTLITVGKMLEAHSKGKTTDALKSLMKIAPKTAVLLRNGQEVTVPISEVQRGDIFVVRPGDSIPVDGIVLEGSGAVDEAALTGESIPVDKAPGSAVSAATINKDGYLRCEARRVGEDTTLSQIIQMVSDAAATKAPIAKIADRVSGVFVPAVLAIACVTTLVWLLLGRPFGFALARGISVLVISCPCSLGLATPVAIMVGNGQGARKGVLFKTAAALEQTGKVNIVALDKTGTITEGRPQVTDLLPADGITLQQLLEGAAALEQHSEHPLARAIMDHAASQQLVPAEISHFHALPGNGLEAQLGGQSLLGGSLKFISGRLSVPAALQTKADTLALQGKTPLLFAQDQQILGLIAVADTIKSDSAEAVRQLQNMGIRVVMITGDNAQTARAIGNQAGVDEVIAGVLPTGKEAAIRRLQHQGKVAMVGDGINDAPALSRADIGFAIGAGSDIALDSAEVVLMHSRLTDVPAAIRLSRATLRNIHQNLFWAFFYNSVSIPVAAGALIRFGFTLNPMLGAACMSLSSFCVVTNALRLNLFKMYDASHDKKRNKPLPFPEEAQEEKTMTKTLKIDGMMCPHCEAAVKKALEAVAGVECAEVSHVAGTAVCTLSADVDNEVLKAAVVAKDYTVLGIE